MQSATRPFDTTTKELVLLRPEDWLPYAGLPRAPIEILPSDLATVVPEADYVLYVRRRHPWLLHFEFQASYDPELPWRVLRYNVLLRYRHGLPVRSIVVLLRPEADGPAMTGQVVDRLPGERRHLSYRYRVLRAWEQPVEEVLVGGLATLPLAPISAVRADELPGVIRRMERRIDVEAAPGQANLLWMSTYLLMGLKYEPEAAARLLRGVRAMKESSTYQAILSEGREEGRLQEAQSTLLRLGTKRLGVPSEAIRAIVEGTTALPRLEAMTDRLFEVERWEDLLAE